nr:MAG TPA: hypothetical protein [Caudoviricetes sp.]
MTKKGMFFYGFLVSRFTHTLTAILTSRLSHPHSLKILSQSSQSPYTLIKFYIYYLQLSYRTSDRKISISRTKYNEFLPI